MEIAYYHAPVRHNPQRHTAILAAEVPQRLVDLISEIQCLHPSWPSKAAVVRWALAYGIERVYADMRALLKARQETWDAAGKQAPEIGTVIQPPDADFSPLQEGPASPVASPDGQPRDPACAAPHTTADRPPPTRQEPS